MKSARDRGIEAWSISASREPHTPGGLDLKPRRVLVPLLTALLFTLGTGWCQGNFKAEAIGAAPSSDLPPTLSSALAAQGVRATSDQGAPVCEVWLLKFIPASPNPSASSDVLYGGLSLGTLLGVVHFPIPTTDFRGQAIKPGFYTLRYALIPQDGNHMGVNPTRDAIVLGPVAADPDPAKTLDFDGLVKLGRQASGTAHPALLVMAPTSGDNFPGVVKDDQGHWDLQVKGQASSGDLPLAVTIAGKYEG